MAWLNSANTIATLVLAVFGIVGYIFGIVTYLSRRANPVRKDTNSTPASQARKTIPSSPISWLEWFELFAQGLLATADFVLILLFHKDYHPEKEPSINKLGYCAGTCVVGALLGELAIGIVIGIFLYAIGVNNATGAAFGITAILLFMMFSFLYIYHVGLLVEEKQLEDYRQMQMQRQRSPE